MVINSGTIASDLRPNWIGLTYAKYQDHFQMIFDTEKSKWLVKANLHTVANASATNRTET